MWIAGTITSYNREHITAIMAAVNGWHVYKERAMYYILAKVHVCILEIKKYV